jgi:hypothetical protein
MSAAKAKEAPPYDGDHQAWDALVASILGSR